MIVTQSVVIPPSWYDRNPGITGCKYLGVGIKDHALTSRASYEISANKIGVFKTFSYSLSVLTQGSDGACYAGLGPAGADTLDDLYCLVWFDNRLPQTSGTVNTVSLEYGGIEGDIIHLYTYSTETVGSMTVYMNLMVNEFDI